MFHAIGRPLPLAPREEELLVFNLDTRRVSGVGVTPGSIWRCCPRSSCPFSSPASFMAEVAHDHGFFDIRSINDVALLRARRSRPWAVKWHSRCVTVAPCRCGC